MVCIYHPFPVKNVGRIIHNTKRHGTTNHQVFQDSFIYWLLARMFTVIQFKTTATGLSAHIEMLVKCCLLLLLIWRTNFCYVFIISEIKREGEKSNLSAHNLTHTKVSQRQKGCNLQIEVEVSFWHGKYVQLYIWHCSQFNMKTN